MNEHPIVTEIRRLAAERPDHRDPNSGIGTVCKYFEDGQPSCIIGHVINKIYPGLPVVEGTLASEALWNIDPQIPVDVLDWASIVQEYQDETATWSEAVKRADGKATRD